MVDPTPVKAMVNRHTGELAPAVLIVFHTTAQNAAPRTEVELCEPVVRSEQQSNNRFTGLVLTSATKEELESELQFTGVARSISR
jgi:hypothetical protein